MRVKSINLLVFVFFTTTEVLGVSNAEWDNRKPLEGDVEVSLPCNYKMIFRKIYTKFLNEDNPIVMNDLSYSAGTNSLDNSSLFSQSLNKRYIQGNFKDKKGYFYYISKYEVMSPQYNALVSRTCKEKLTLKDQFPITNISWFDAMDFNRKFSNYIQQNKVKIPDVINTEDVFVRLPLEEEWEFAARGGRLVSEGQFNADLPPLGEGKGINDYAWHQGLNGKLNLSGLKEPNPLGLFDMLGNASEMMFEPFHATRTGRLHGQGGGFIVRGGSFLNSQVDISNYTRSERKYYIKGQENKSKDMGFRVVIATPLVESIDEAKKLNTEVKLLGTSSSEDDPVTSRSMSMVDNLAASKIVTENEELKNSINSLHSEMVKANSERDEMRNAAIISNIRLGGFLCKALSDELATYHFFYQTAEKMKQRCDEGNKIMCENYKKQKATADKFMNNLDYLANYYGDNISYALNTYGIGLINKQGNTAKINGNNDSKSLLANFIDVYLNHLKLYLLQPKNLPELKEMWISNCNTIVKK
ncbi:MAG: SUMF1/EgtB/PvdO family nonheme iron enzyme [Succinivibrionaceae bacterium]